MSKVSISIQIEAETKQKLFEIADADCRSMSSLVEKIIKNYLDDKKQID